MNEIQAASTTIFTSPTLEVYYQERHSEFVVVTFSPSNYVFDGSTFWGMVPLGKAEIASVGIVARTANWFPESEMAPALVQIRPLVSKYKKLIVFGASMGGFAALKYSNALSATSCLAFSPQFSINPKDVQRFDRRFMHNYKYDLHGDMAVREADLARHTLIIFDPEEKADNRHVKHLKRLAPRVSAIEARGTGHSTIGLFAGTSNLTRLLKAVTSDDLPSVLLQTSELRKSSDLCRMALIDKVLRRRSVDLALRFFEKHGNLYNPRQAAKFHNRASWAYIKNNQYLKAEIQSLKAISLDPKNSKILQRMALIQEKLGRNDRCSEYLEASISAAPRDFSAHEAAIDFYRRSGQPNHAKSVDSRWASISGQ